MNLFLDLDGVIFNFDAHYLHTFGEKPEDAKTKDDMWRTIATKPDFFITMPLIEGAADFYHRYAYLHPTFLTHAPVNKFGLTFEEISRQKIQAVQQIGFEGLVIPVPGYGKKLEKALYMQRPGDILVDDWGKNVDAWIAAGGVGIKHESFEHTIAEMEWHLYRLSHPDITVS